MLDILLQSKDEFCPNSEKSIMDEIMGSTLEKIGY